MQGDFIPQFPGKVDRNSREYVVNIVYRGEGPLDGAECVERIPLRYSVEIGSGIVASGAVMLSLKQSIRRRIFKYNRGVRNLRLEETLENSIEGLKAKALLADLEISENGREKLDGIAQI